MYVNQIKSNKLVFLIAHFYPIVHNPCVNSMMMGERIVAEYSITGPGIIGFVNYSLRNVQIYYCDIILLQTTGFTLYLFVCLAICIFYHLRHTIDIIFCSCCKSAFHVEEKLLVVLLGYNTIQSSAPLRLTMSVWAS